MSHEDLPVLLTWADEGDMLEVRGYDASGVPTPVVGALADLARDVLGLSPGSRVGARLFECHPDDLRLLDEAAHKFVDGSGFMRAFAHDEDHQFLVNARFREMGSTTSVAFDPASVAMLAMQAQTQMTLERMELVLEDLRSTLDALVRTVRVEREADVLSALEMIAEVWGRYRDSGTVSETDWDRIAHLEQTLRKRHREVIGELDAVASAMRFTTLKEARTSRKITRQSVRNLVTLEVYLRHGLTQHLQLSLALRQVRGEATRGLANEAGRVLERYGSMAHRTYDSVRAIDSDAKEKSVLKMLMTKGIFAGRRDNAAIYKARANRSDIQSELPPAAPALPVAPMRHLVSS
jgi:hypothetical protein